VVRVFGGVRRLGLRQQFPDLGAQLPLPLLHPAIAHRLVLAGIGFQLGAVQGHPPQCQCTRFQRDLQHLFEQPCQRGQMELAEICDRAKVRQVARRQYPKPHVFGQAPLDAPGAKYPHAIPVHQHLGHHPRIVRRLPALLVTIHRIQRRQVQIIHHIADEIDQVILRQPLAQARRK
jgi:hypothetical protein